MLNATGKSVCRHFIGDNVRVEHFVKRDNSTVRE